MFKLLLLVVYLFLWTPLALFAQPVSTGPVFDVASVKLTHEPKIVDGSSYSDVKIVSPGRLVAINASFDECIRWAYRLKEFEIAGPMWLKSKPHYEIEAKAPPDTSIEVTRLMFQSLLSERFKLKFHREVQSRSVYNLVVSKNGPKLREADPGVAIGFVSFGGSDGVKIESEGADMDALVHRLSLDLDRPVLDKTAIRGNFRIALSWAREGDGPSVFAAIQEQLGLKLESTKSPIEIFVVDFAEQTPTPN